MGENYRCGSVWPNYVTNINNNLIEMFYYFSLDLASIMIIYYGLFSWVFCENKNALSYNYEYML